MAVAVIDHGKICYVRAYGIRNAKGDRLTTGTVMYGASLTTRHEYRDVTALSWGRRFHAPIFVSQPALQLIEAAGGVE